MKEAVINIDSLPVEYFSVELFKGLEYELKRFRTFPERPSFSFLGEFITGKPPSETNLWFDFVRSEKSPYRFFPTPFGCSVPDRPIWLRRVLMMLSKLISGKTYNPHNIPACLLKEFDAHPAVNELYKKMNPIISESRGRTSEAIAGEISVVEQGLLESSKEFVFANYSKLDPIGHQYGPKSAKYKKYYKKIFESVKNVFLSKKYNRLTVISDHGMYPVKKYLDPREVISNFSGKSFVVFVNSPVLRIWGKPEIPKSVIETLRGLENQGIGHLLGKQDFAKWKLPQDGQFGEVIFWLREGYYWLPDFYHGHKKIKGMHNYWGSGKRFECVFSRGG